jgi:hypothetical protein
VTDRKPSPDERAARLEALLDDIQDEKPSAPPAAPSPASSIPPSSVPPAADSDMSSPDLESLDAAWDEEDEAEDRDRTVIGAMPDLIAKTREAMNEPPSDGRATPVKTVIVDAKIEVARVASNGASTAPPPRAEPIIARPSEKKLVAERAIARQSRKEKQRARADATRERKRAKAEAVAAKQKQKQAKPRRSPSEPRPKASGYDATADTGDIPATEAPADFPTVRTKMAKRRDMVRMIVMVALVVLAGGAVLFMLRR